MNNMNLIIKEKLDLYYQMLLIRKIEERIAEEYSNYEMRCPVHLSVGQEACAVGVCNNLKKNDILYSTHRSHAHYIAKQGNINSMIAEIGLCVSINLNKVLESKSLLRVLSLISDVVKLLLFSSANAVDETPLV